MESKCEIDMTIDIYYVRIAQLTHTPHDTEEEEEEEEVKNIGYGNDTAQAQSTWRTRQRESRAQHERCAVHFSNDETTCSARIAMK